ncbi:MAG: flavin reductase family protein [Candidatus Woesearchaeota archaeon]
MADDKPQQVILVSTRGKAELLGKTLSKDNVMTVAWHMPMSFDPKLYGISIGKNRFSRRLIDDSKVFTINFMAYGMQDKVIYCGQNSGAAVDKFSGAGLTKEECSHIDCCRIKEASAYMECEVIDQFETGDHIVYVGKVIKENTNDDRKRLLHIGGNKFTSTL